MRFSRIVGIFVVAIIAAVALSFAAPASIAGDYRCSGMSEGKGYTMDLTVKQFGETTEWEWSVPDGVAFAGLGLEKDGYIAVAMLGAKGVGIAMYQFEEGTLRGEWSAGKGAIEREVCTPRGRVRA